MPRWVLWAFVVILVAWMLLDPNSLADFVKYGWDAVLAFAKGMLDG